MVGEDSSTYLATRVKDGKNWPIGGAAQIAWIAEGTAPSADITSAIPPIYAAYCTLTLPKPRQRRHDLAVVELLGKGSEPQPWWLGYLETGIGADIVFYDAPRVRLYCDWGYVLVQAGPKQAVSWRQSEGPQAPWKGALPDLMFPANRSWLFSTLWDDHWSCIGGSEALIADFINDPELGRRARTVVPGEDVAPPSQTSPWPDRGSSA
jgi:hypothetical protein